MFATWLVNSRSFAKIVWLTILKLSLDKTRHNRERRAQFWNFTRGPPKQALTRSPFESWSFENSEVVILASEILHDLTCMIHLLARFPYRSLLHYAYTLCFQYCFLRGWQRPFLEKNRRNREEKMINILEYVNCLWCQIEFKPVKKSLGKN